MKRLHAMISGHVQGVNFRHYTVQEARRLHVRGWVRNNPDGKVEVTAEGKENALESLLAFLHEGSPAAQVDDVKAQWQAASGEFDGFVVRYKAGEA